MTVLEILGSFALFFIVLGVIAWSCGALKVSVEWDRG